MAAPGPRRPAARPGTLPAAGAHDRGELFFTALRRHARQHGGGELRAWGSERETAEHLYRSTWDAEHEPHPDGLGIWAEGG